VREEVVHDIFEAGEIRIAPFARRKYSMVNTVKTVKIANIPEARDKLTQPK
jgi:hypothetical protein